MTLVDLRHRVEYGIVMAVRALSGALPEPLTRAMGTVIGWTCTISSHKICTAGPDGRWKECTFSPKFIPWPAPVPRHILNKPSLADPPSLPQ